MQVISGDYRQFASVAEAVAHYVIEGFDTVSLGNNCRTMRRVNGDGCDEVKIKHNGLLDVSSLVVTIMS